MRSIPRQVNTDWATANSSAYRGGHHVGADTAKRVRQRANEAGLLLLLCGPFGNVGRMIPPLWSTPRKLTPGSASGRRCSDTVD
jgi:4-aminobutyrate aminotransferase-like enzyme